MELIKLALYLQCNQICNHYIFTISNMDTIKQHLQDHNVKPSLQRMAIMKYLLENRTHPTADRIFNDLYPQIPTLSKTTVYNTLKLLCDHGAVTIINIDEKNVRYDGDTSPHAHFRCKGCGCVHDIQLEPNSSIYRDSVGDFTILDVQVYYKGYCKECLEPKYLN